MQDGKTLNTTAALAKKKIELIEPNAKIVILDKKKLLSRAKSAAYLGSFGIENKSGQSAASVSTEADVDVDDVADNMDAENES